MKINLWGIKKSTEEILAYFQKCQAMDFIPTSDGMFFHDAGKKGHGSFILEVENLY